MIEVITGTPGACKTLSRVDALARMLARWDKHPEEARPVFVHGVKNLALAHCVMPTKVVRIQGKDREVPDWDAMPEGSWVLIDEAQHMFPARSSNSETPDHVAWLNTHRHRGFDITVVTQHPKLIDPAVRALAGKHVHYRRLFGGKRSASYEWDMCCDSLTLRTANVTGYYPFPARAFEWYKSAEVHTKQRFALPKWVFVPVAGLALSAYAVPKLLTQMHKMQHPQSIAVAAAPASAASVGALAPTRPAAPPPAVLAAQSASAPARVVGCVSMHGRSMCVDSAGHTFDDPLAEVSSREFGHLVAVDMTAPKPSESAHNGRTQVAEANDDAPGPVALPTGDFRERALLPRDGAATPVTMEAHSIIPMHGASSSRQGPGGAG